MDDRDTVIFKELLEFFFEIDILTGANRNTGGVFQSVELLMHLPGNHVFDPGQAIFFHSSGKEDRIFDTDMSEMIDGQRHFITDDVSDFFDIVLQIVQSFFGDVDPGERMGGIDDIVAVLVADHVGCDRSALDIQDMRSILLHVIDETQRSADRSRFIQ